MPSRAAPGPTPAVPKAPITGAAGLGEKATRPNGCWSAAGAESSKAMANRRGCRPGTPLDLGCRKPCDRNRHANGQKPVATRAATGRPAQRITTRTARCGPLDRWVATGVR